MTDTRPPTESPFGPPLPLQPLSAVASTPVTSDGVRIARERAFEEFHNRYWAWLCACARSHLSSTEDAEDLVQDVLLKAWMKDVVGEFGGEEYRLRAYVLSMIDFGAIDVQRARGRERDGSAKYFASFRLRRRRPETPDENLMAKELKREVDLALQQLPELDREAFRLARLLRTPYAVVAERLHMNVNTLSAQLTETYRHVLERLVERGYLPDGYSRRKKKENRS